MNKKLFTQIHDQKKKKINIALDPGLKKKLVELKKIDSISISERVEDLYRSHESLVKDILVPALPRSRGERGKPMYGDGIRTACGIFLTPDAIAFFDEQAQNQNSDRSQVIESAVKKVYFAS
jgi:hypothetical protein